MRPSLPRSLNQQVLQKLGVPAARLPQHSGTDISRGVALVREVLKENEAGNANGWRTGEIFNLARAKAFPAGEENPIKSKTFLKEILAHMQGYKDIRLVRQSHVKEGATTAHDAFVWRIFDKSKLPNPPKVTVREPSLGIPLGLHEDFSHLNKRRQRARKENIVRGILKLKAEKKAEAEKAAAAASS